MKKLTNFKFQSVICKLLSTIFLSVCIIFSICVYHSFAEVPCKINYQGRLIKDNVPVHNPTPGVPMIFKVDGKEVYNSVNDGNVPVYNGLFRVVLDLENKGIDWTAGEEKSLEVTVDGELLSPAEPIYAYPYAINSHLLEGSTKEYFLNVSDETQKKEGGLNIMGNVGIGTTNPKGNLDVRGYINIQDGKNAAVIYFPNTGDYPNFYIRSDDDPTTYELESERLFIGSDGNVGIGTTNPGTNKLEVVGGPIKATGGLIIETRTSDPSSPVTGQMWLRTDQ